MVLTNIDRVKEIRWAVASVDSPVWKLQARSRPETRRRAQRRPPSQFVIVWVRERSECACSEIGVKAMVSICYN